MSVDQVLQQDFQNLNLSAPILKVLDSVGYETPTPIQAQMIPHMLAGRDVLGQAQTGTGKTAAFALPLLSRIDLKKTLPQVLVLTPTRELAIQVSEAFQRYAAHLKGFHVLPVYGGQPYEGQLRQLQRGAHVVVGTPGRVMDHIRRETLDLKNITCLVLDEADEMLRMGFIEDVEWIMQQTPPGRQVALFSATLPPAVRRIAQRHLQDPVEITIKVLTTTPDTIHHRYWLVSGVQKLDALTRILESEPFDGIIVFVRTKTAAVELAERLEARGYSAAPLNSDISQRMRERTIEQLKSGKLDILVATDVAARGLDVDRISHVINYDIPYDPESYVHRVGRTGRAGRTGEAILFVAPRERRMLAAIEKATRHKINMMTLPSTALINDRRVARFKQRITETLAAGGIEFFSGIVEQYSLENDVPVPDIAAALAKLAQGNTPLLLPDRPASVSVRAGDTQKREPRPFSRERSEGPPEKGKERFRIEVGHMHGVKPGNIVGALINEAGLDSTHIGHIVINDAYSTVDLPEGMPRDIFRALKKVWVAGQQLRISRMEENGKESAGREKHEVKPRGGKKPDAHRHVSHKKHAKRS